MLCCTSCNTSPVAIMVFSIFKHCNEPLLQEASHALSTSCSSVTVPGRGCLTPKIAHAMEESVPWVPGVVHAFAVVVCDEVSPRQLVGRLSHTLEAVRSPDCVEHIRRTLLAQLCYQERILSLELANLFREHFNLFQCHIPLGLDLF